MHLEQVIDFWKYLKIEKSIYNFQTELRQVSYHHKCKNKLRIPGKNPRRKFIIKVCIYVGFE